MENSKWVCSLEYRIVLPIMLGLYTGCFIWIGVFLDNLIGRIIVGLLLAVSLLASYKLIKNTFKKVTDSESNPLA